MPLAPGRAAFAQLPLPRPELLHLPKPSRALVRVFPSLLLRVLQPAVVASLPAPFYVWPQRAPCVGPCPCGAGVAQGPPPPQPATPAPGCAPAQPAQASPARPPLLPRHRHGRRQSLHLQVSQTREASAGQQLELAAGWRPATRGCLEQAPRFQQQRPRAGRRPRVAQPFASGAPRLIPPLAAVFAPLLSVAVALIPPARSRSSTAQPRQSRPAAAPPAPRTRPWQAPPRTETPPWQRWQQLQQWPHAALTPEPCSWPPPRQLPP
mmetsp:Transcript_21309/g.50066  ORF Transcript_21309/g.50066 Transcript_21309/m.50066 type:complete len:265 (-) Transcript_21309:916-1710(-)